MNTALYKLATRFRNGAWQWSAPGYNNVVRYLPAHLTRDDWDAALYWPSRGEKGEQVVCLCHLRRHRGIASAAVRTMLR